MLVLPVHSHIARMKTTRNWSSEHLACGELQYHACKRDTLSGNQAHSTEDHCSGEHKCPNRCHVCSELIAVALLLTLAFCCLNADLLVILFESRQVFASLREFALFHALANVPVHKRTLRVHKVELVINAREDLCNRS